MEHLSESCEAYFILLSLEMSLYMPAISVISCGSVDVICEDI